MASDNGIVIAASYWGKFKTVFQMAMIIVLIADLGVVCSIDRRNSYLGSSGTYDHFSDRLRVEK